MKINKRKTISTLALIGLTLGTTVSAAEVLRKPKFDLAVGQQSILEEAHQLHMQGKDEEARRLIEAAGIEVPKVKNTKSRHPNAKHVEKFKTLIEQNDFESFQSLAEGTPMAGIINTEEKFEALVQAHELRLEGRHDEAKEVLKEAGLKFFGKKVRNLK